MNEPLMITLQEAPALLDAVQSVGALRQLRAVCTTARRLATSIVSKAQLHLESADQQVDVLPVLQACKLTKLQLIADDVRPFSSSIFSLSSAAIKGALAHLLPRHDLCLACIAASHSTIDAK